MPFGVHVDEAGYVRRLHELFRKYRESSTEEEGFDRLSLCYFGAPYDEFYLVSDAVDW